MLYSFNKNYPIHVPFRIRLSDGSTRTEPSSFTVEELADAGFIQVEDRPIAVKGKVIEWSYEFGTWLIRDKTEQEIHQESENRRSEINAHRDARIAAGFTFQDKTYDSRPEDQKRISGAAQLAFMAVVGGAQPNDYLWAGSVPFGWIAQDNTITLMDAQTVIEFAKTAAEWERKHIFTARSLKDMEIVPENYNDDEWWA